MSQRPPYLEQPVPRIDGRAKVTGTAQYTADVSLERMAYGVPLCSTIASGTILQIDTREAEAAPGVITVITHQNAPQLPSRPPVTPQNRMTRAVPVLQDKTIHAFGQYIGLVVAETAEQARHAARLVRVRYEETAPRVDFTAHLDRAYKPPVINAGYPTDTVRGDVEAALRAARVTHDAIYDTPIQHHHPMEPHATVAAWDEDRLTVYETTQIVSVPVQALAATFRIPPENIRVLAPYLGGGFGSKLVPRGQLVMAVLAARMIRRPVKIVLTRQQMFTNAGLRQHNRQRVRLAAGADGRLAAVAHEIVTHTSMEDEFIEQTGVMTRMLYDMPNSLVTHRVVPINVQVPTYTRAPGETPGSFALESAMDELACALDMDPIALRVKNEPSMNPEDGRPWSSRRLIECLRAGAEAFDWSRRSSRPRAHRQGDWLVGYGVAASSRGAPHRAASARLTLTRSGAEVRAVIEMAATDIGTGSYTIIAQTAAAVLELPLEQIAVRLGDSALPATPGSGGSWGAVSFTSAVAAVCERARESLAASAGSASTRPIAELMQAANLPRFETEVEEKPSPAADAYARFTFGANFAEVWVDERLGIVRVPRFVAAIAAGRILNPQTARSQIIGGVVWGIGQALTEETRLDARSGRYVTRTLADYHVPVNADIGTIDTLFVDEDDRRANRMGVKGLGEIGIISVAAAIANAVYNATGRRIRDLPITPAKLVQGAPVHRRQDE